MTRQEATEILGTEEVEDRDKLRDAYEKKCFDIRNYLLWHPVVPPVLKSRLKKLVRYGVAYALLTGSEEEKVEDPFPDGRIPVSMDPESARELIPGNDLRTVLKEYEQAMARKKLPLANSFNAPALVSAIEILINVQNAYHTRYAEFFPAPWEDVMAREERERARGGPPLFDRSVKIGKQVDSGELIQGIDTLARAGLDVHEVLEDLGKGGHETLLYETTYSDILYKVITEGYRIHRLFQLKG